MYMVLTHFGGFLDPPCLGGKAMLSRKVTSMAMESVAGSGCACGRVPWRLQQQKHQRRGRSGWSGGKQSKTT